MSIYVPSTWKYIDYRGFDGNCFVFLMLNTHPVVILPKAWSFLRFPSPKERRETARIDEVQRGGQNGRRTVRGETRIHAARNTGPVRYVFAELWVDLHIETVRGCETDLLESRQSGRDSTRTYATSLLNLRRWSDFGIKYCWTEDQRKKRYTYSSVTIVHRGWRCAKEPARRLRAGRNNLFSPTSFALNWSTWQLGKVRPKFNMVGGYSKTGGNSWRRRGKYRQEEVEYKYIFSINPFTVIKFNARDVQIHFPRVCSFSSSFNFSYALYAIFYRLIKELMRVIANG